MHLCACTRPRTRTHRPICNTYCFFTATTIRGRASVLRYTYEYIACLVLICCLSLCLHVLCVIFYHSDKRLSFYARRCNGLVYLFVYLFMILLHPLMYEDGFECSYEIVEVNDQLLWIIFRCFCQFFSFKWISCFRFVLFLQATDVSALLNLACAICVAPLSVSHPEHKPAVAVACSHNTGESFWTITSVFPFHRLCAFPFIYIRLIW